jgi:hypothetical protein
LPFRSDQILLHGTILLPHAHRSSPPFSSPLFRPLYFSLAPGCNFRSPVRPNFLIPLCFRSVIFVVIIFVIIFVIILIIILVIIFLLLFISFDLAVASKDEDVSFLKKKSRTQ